jgi:excisionase family DNA binding protein
MVSRRGVSGRLGQQRPPEIGPRPPASPFRGDRSRRLVVPWCHMETTAPASTPNTSAADTLLLTLDEAARELRCARRSVERQIARHRLAVVHVGRSVRVERRELERFIARLRNPHDHV